MLSSDVLRVFSQFETSKKNAYNWVSGLLTRARDNGLFPWEAVVDNGRRSETYHSYEDMGYYAWAEGNSAYKLDPWRGQACRIEIIVEKDGLVDMVARYVKKWRIPVRSLDGFNSTTKSKEAAKRYGTGKGYIIFCCGDFDPSGILIPQSLKNKLNQYGSYPDIRRLTLVKQDTLHLPDYAAVEVSSCNPHRMEFQRLYGAKQKGYEIEVLTPTQLEQRVLNAISAHVDEEAFNAAVELEKEIRREVGSALKDALKGYAKHIQESGVPDNILSLEDQLRYFLDTDRYEEFKRTGEVTIRKWYDS
jgi:5S rRNA maturation endonuclease (ribonuclease M5)